MLTSQHKERLDKLIEADKLIKCAKPVDSSSTEPAQNKDKNKFKFVVQQILNKPTHWKKQRTG